MNSRGTLGNMLDSLSIACFTMLNCLPMNTIDTSLYPAVYSIVVDCQEMHSCLSKAISDKRKGREENGTLTRLADSISGTNNGYTRHLMCIYQ